ncbi:MAG: DEAD/DEAH box helicase family protein [Burkholderiales bacterium]
MHPGRGSTYNLEKSVLTGGTTSHESPRPVQVEAFEALDVHINERDVVLKVSTGSGKTIVGLVYAERMRRNYPDQAVIYLCPTTLLIEQVVKSAADIGVPVATFPDIQRASEGKAVIVCTYDRLFNARNVFATRGITLSAVIMDDVHAGSERTRRAYSCPGQVRPLLEILERDAFFTTGAVRSA